MVVAAGWCRLGELERLYGRKVALGLEVGALKRSVKSGGGMAFRSELRSMKRVRHPGPKGTPPLPPPHAPGRVSLHGPGLAP